MKGKARETVGENYSCSFQENKEGLRSQRRTTQRTGRIHLCVKKQVQESVCFVSRSSHLLLDWGPPKYPSRNPLCVERTLSFWIKTWQEYSFIAFIPHLSSKELKVAFMALTTLRCWELVTGSRSPSGFHVSLGIWTLVFQGLPGFRWPSLWSCRWSHGTSQFPFPSFWCNAPNDWSKSVSWT